MIVMNDEEKKVYPTEEIIDDGMEEKVLMVWEAAERAFKRRDRDFWITAIAILVLVGVIFIMIKEFFLVIALASILFLAYVLSTVPPENVVCKITNRGIYFGDSHYGWDLLERFWFKKSLDSDAVFFETRLRFPRQVSMIIDKSNEEKIKEIVAKRIPMMESSPSTIDKLTNWFAQRLPLEDRKEKSE
jgi:hypothetical protein